MFIIDGWTNPTKVELGKADIMKKTKKEKPKELSTFEREMQDAKFKAAFEHEYAEIWLQELLAAMSQGDEKSVLALAKAAALHPMLFKNLRSGKTA